MSGARSRNPYVQWYQQHQTLVWGTAAAAAVLYATYKATSNPDAEEKTGHNGRPQKQQSQFQRLRAMMHNYSVAASTLGETAALVSSDLRTFLTSDAAELPQSLRQLNKLLQASELQDTVSTVTASVVRGVTSATAGILPTEGPPLVDTIIEAVLSERGRGLIGMAVGVAMRNATTAVCEFAERRMDAAAPGSAGGFTVKDVLELLSSDQGEKVLTLLLTQSIRTAVTSYVDVTAGYNPYSDMLASLVNHEHRDALTDLLSRLSASFCREAVVAYRRTPTTTGPVMTAATTTASSASYPANHAAAKNTSAAGSCSTGTATSCAPPLPTTTTCVPSGAMATVIVAGVSTGEGQALVADGRAATAAVLPLVKSNGQLLGGQNGRPSQSSQSNKLQHSASGSNTALMGLSRALTVQAPPPWLRQVVELVKERDVRSLAVDVVKSASREATRGAVEGFLQGSGVGYESSSPLGPGGVLVLPPGATGYKLYVLATLAVTLCMYALSPRVMLI